MADQDEGIEALFEGLSPRQEPPAAARERAFTAAFQAFEAQRTRRQWRSRAILAAAACLLIALTLAPRLTQQTVGFEVELADAAYLEVDGRFPDGSQQRLDVLPGTLMHARQATRLTLAPTTDLRLAADTSIRWVNARSIELTRGTLFIDTREAGDMQVITARGTVTDIGTRFLVSYSSGQLEVAMRSGSTEIDSDLGLYQARADGLIGDVLTVSEQQVSHRSEPTDAARWRWIDTVPRGYDETSVQLLLEEIARDLGVEVAYETAGAEAWVMNMALKGESLERLTPTQAMDVVATASGTSISVGPGRILHVSLR